MSTQMITYSCSDFDRILWGSRNIILPDNVKELIEKITNEVGDPTYNRTPNFSKEDKSYYKKKKGFTDGGLNKIKPDVVRGILTYLLQFLLIDHPFKGGRNLLSIIS